MNLYECDIVISWVDGKDPEWRAKREQCEKGCRDHPRYICSPSTLETLYSEHGELLYALRSIESHCFPFRNVIIVSEGHLPSWLNLSAKGLRTVSHDQFIPKEKLPTFNSQAIEAYLHLIPGLSDAFFYFNDDVLVMRDMAEQCLFDQHSGKLLIPAEPHISPRGPLQSGESLQSSTWKNLNRLLDVTAICERPYLEHVPLLHYKSVFEEAWIKYKGPLERTASRRFRTLDCIPVTNGLIPYLAIIKGYAELSSCSCMTVELSELSDISTADLSFLCIQSTLSDIPEGTIPKAISVLDSLFPESSSFEQ